VMTQVDLGLTGGLTGFDPANPVISVNDGN
jgi:hypothetical protein